MMHHGFTLAFPHDFEYRVSARTPACGDTIHARGALWTVTEVHGKRYVLRQVIIAELALSGGSSAGHDGRLRVDELHHPGPVRV